MADRVTLQAASRPLPGLFSLDGQVALVTGASRGLGLEVARAMAEAGARAVLAGRDRSRLEAAAGSISGTAHEPVIADFDFTDPDATRAALRRIREEAGRLDILVHNAGARDRKPLAEFSDADIRALIDTNLTAGVVLAREAGRPGEAQARARTRNPRGAGPANRRDPAGGTARGPRQNTMWTRGIYCAPLRTTTSGR